MKRSSQVNDISKCIIVLTVHKSLCSFLYLQGFWGYTLSRRTKWIFFLVHILSMIYSLQCVQFTLSKTRINAVGLILIDLFKYLLRLIGRIESFLRFMVIPSNQRDYLTLHLNSTGVTYSAYWSVIALNNQFNDPW